MSSLIVILASTHFDGHQLYDERLARALVPFGKVVYVDPPLPLGRRGRTKERSSTTAGLTVDRPRMLPFGRRRLLHPVTAAFLGLRLRRVIRSHLTVGGRPSYVVVASPTSTLKMLPPGRSVHLILDDYISGAELIGISPKVLERRFIAQLPLVQQACAVSPRLRDVLFRLGVRASVVPAGCAPDDSAHPEPRDLVGVAAPRAVFIGMLSDRIDFDMLRAVVDAGLNLVMVGPTQNTFTKHAQLRQLSEHRRVRRLEPRSGSDLHAVLQHCDVGLIPYEQNAFNDSSFPLKAFEYLAAGLQVVTTPLPAMAWLGHDVIRLASDPRSFSAAALEASRTHDSYADRCRAVAAENSWDRRAAVFAELLGLDA